MPLIAVTILVLALPPVASHRICAPCPTSCDTSHVYKVAVYFSDVILYKVAIGS